ncbi:MAG TPA: TadE/TadG family type IV pilus assembly protein [Nitriliruptorales bacterium]
MTTPTMRARCRRVVRDDEGAAVLEFALVAVAFLALLYGIVTFGLIFAVEQTLTHAAAEGARAAVSARPGDELAESTAATQHAIGWLGGVVAAGDVSSSIEACEHDAAVRCVRVRIDYPYGARPIVPPFPLLAFATPDTIRTEAVASLRS